MIEFSALLNTVDKVKDFVHIVSRCPYDVDICSGRYVVDGKSIMGLFSLDLAEPVDVRLMGDDCDEILKQLEPYIVD